MPATADLHAMGQSIWLDNITRDMLNEGTIAGFIGTRPSWLKWQRRITGSLLAAVAVMLAREVPQAARA